jgi:hypothetical protein
LDELLGDAVVGFALGHIHVAQRIDFAHVFGNAYAGVNSGTPERRKAFTR